MFKRSPNNPILKPNPKSPWEASQVYNPGVLYEKRKFHLFYRAVGRAWVSKIGYAESKDGKNFKRSTSPLLTPETELEKNGVEDPRVTKIGDAYYLTYTAYDGDTACLCSTVSKDLKVWQRQGEMIPNWNAGRAQSFTVSWDNAHNNSAHKDRWIKSGAIFPEMINGYYWMLFGSRNIWLGRSHDCKKWEPVWEPFLKPRPGNYFDNVHVEMGPPPIKTEKGWLVLYHGIDKKIVYRLGLILLDLENPDKIIYRSEKSIFEPEEPYELSGIVDILPGGFKAMEKMSKAELNKYIQKAKDDKTMPNVIFCCGAVVVNGILRIYYGASDSVICTATAPLNNILKITESR